ncbi:MAG: hypothetical protein V1816_22525 [Pseudomonadota bacterium]
MNVKQENPNQPSRGPGGAAGAGTKRGLESRSSGPVENSEDHCAGLCLNCLHRTECNLPKNEGGVWYCEEYE